MVMVPGEELLMVSPVISRLGGSWSPGGCAGGGCSAGGGVVVVVMVSVSLQGPGPSSV